MFYFDVFLLAALFFLISGLVVVFTLAFKISSKEKRRDNPPDV